MARILFISGSPRKKATDRAVHLAMDAVKDIPGIEVDYLSLQGKKITPCVDCQYCKKNHAPCILQDDMGKEIYQQFIKADAYFVASPVYMMGPTPQILAYFSRMRPVSVLYDKITHGRLGCALAVGGTRNGGQEITVSILHNCMATYMINLVTGDLGAYHGGKIWSKDLGAEGVEADEIGLATALPLAKKLAETALIMEAGRKARGLQGV